MKSIMNYLPPEINYNIIKLSHPYYADKFCEANRNEELCELSKYDMIQLWITPQLSIREIKERFPYVTYKEVAKAALAYYPIPESIGEYDPVTLFYNSCRTNQDNAYDYISLYYPESTKDSSSSYYIDNIIVWTCYKFNRLDIFEKVVKYIRLKRYSLKHYKSLENLLRIKSNLKLISGYSGINWNDFMNASYMFTKEELLDVIIAASKVEIEMQISRSQNALDYLLTGEERFLEGFPIFRYFILTLASMLGKKTVLSIINKYYPDLTIPEGVKYTDKSSQISFSLIGSDFSNIMIMQQNPKLMKDLINIAELGTFYCSTGMFLDYENWKKSDNKLGKFNINDIRTISVWGLVALNKDLASALNIDINAPPAIDRFTIDQFQH